MIINETKFLLLYAISALIISFFIGRKRQIGFLWSLFFCCTLTPVLGFLVTIFSIKYDKPNPNYSRSNLQWGYALIVIFAGGMLSQLLKKINDPQLFYLPLDTIVFQIGMLGLGIYLTQIGYGKSFNKKKGV